MADDDTLLRMIWEELREIKYWVRLTGLPVIRRAILENLRDDESKMVYQLSDGNRSTREIVAELGRNGMEIAHNTIAVMWRRWAVAGIVEPSERYQGRFKRVVSLELLGIEVPRSIEEGVNGNK